MIAKVLYKIKFALVLLLVAMACKKESTDILKVYPSDILMPREGGIEVFTIETSADSWNLENKASDWIEVSPTSGTKSRTLITIEVNSKSIETRSGNLIIQSGNADPVNVVVVQTGSEFIYSFSSETDEVSFGRSGGTIELTISSTAPEWTLTNSADWLEVSDNSGSSGSTTLTLNTNSNENVGARIAQLTFSAEYAEDFTIRVRQTGRLYPNYNTSPIPADETGMTKTAAQLANEMTVGWNVGNSLEATGGETNWGNPKVSRSLIQSVKANGFNTVRIPVSWNQYADQTTGKISETWFIRIKEVVDYCIDEDMYVMLNIHWDGGWLERNVNPEAQENVNEKQRAFWQQIATNFRDYYEHLLFASANEPIAENAVEMDVLLSYHQTFVDAVRETGGRNAHRVLIVQGPSTNFDLTNELMHSLPDDNVSYKMMVEVHFYSPYPFALMAEDQSWGNMFYYWGKGNHSTTEPERNPTWGEEDFIDEQMSMMKDQFVSRGIPVVMGEYGAIRRSSLTGESLELHLKSRAYFLEYVTKQAKASGIIPVYWDNGSFSNNGFALFSRSNGSVVDQQALDAIIKGATE